MTPPRDGGGGPATGTANQPRSPHRQDQAQAHSNGEQPHSAAFYAHAYPIYLDYGWTAPLKLAAGTKHPPPTGFTGRNGVTPSGADMHAWAEEEPDGNIALRLPDDIIGIDVDDYDGKTGAATLVEAEHRWGELPFISRSTSRPGTQSGIRPYRIPAGHRLRDRITFPGEKLGGIEVIQHHHRYVMCWPSIHNRTGQTYQWLGIDDGPLATPPRYPDDIPALPDTWLGALAETNRAEADSTDDPPYQVQQALTDGEPTRRVAERLGQAILGMQAGSRHDSTRDNVATLLRYGKQGDGGVRAALTDLKKAFVQRVGPDRAGGTAEAAGEFEAFINSDRMAELLAEPDHHASSETGWRGKAIEVEADRMRVRAEAKRIVDAETRVTPTMPAVKPLDALLAEPDSPVPYRIDRVAPVDARIIMSAQFKAGKTILVDNMIRALADSDPFLGQFTVHQPARRIVLIDDELSENMLRQWLREQRIANTAAVADVVSLRGKVSAFNILDDHTRSQWAQRLAELGCDYLLLDCLRPVLDSLGLDENRDAGTFLVAYDALLDEAGITDSALVHHMGHTNERSRGDSRLQDWPDAIWRLVRETEQPDSTRFFSAYGRDVNVAEGRLAFDAGARRLTYVAGSRVDAKTREAALAVIRLLADHARDGGQGMSKNSIVCVSGGPAQNTVRAAFKQLTGSELIRESTGKGGAKPLSIANPCAACGMPLTAGQTGQHLSCPTEPELPDEAAVF